MTALRSTGARPGDGKGGPVRCLLALLTVVVAATGCASTSSGGATPSAGHVATPPVATTAAAGSAGSTASPPHRIGHVFVIVIENHSFAATYRDNPNRYLGHRLQQRGTLLTQYYAIGHYSLDNYVAMISGQAPNPATSADCGHHVNFNNTTKPARLDVHGQAIGSGCVYPRNVKTLGDQLSAHHISWRGYMDQMGRVHGREQHRCGIPSLSAGGYDQTERATRRDQYAARHNPFVYFHSLIGSGLCRKHVVALHHLRQALQRVASTPRFAFITPDLCNDGHDSPCVGHDAMGSSAGGLVSVDHFLRTWVPLITHSPAFRRNGLLVITSDESEGGDASSCCRERPGPNEAKPGITGPGGGRVGALLLGPCVRRGARDATPYNHYSLLRTLEDIYRITSGGTDGHGHLGYAAAARLRPFGKDALGRCAP